jgi:hypothetical protein
MPFTDRDHINELLIKIIIAEASTDGVISEKEKEIILEWIQCLQIEGPEYKRILSLFDAKIDAIQAEIFYNELKAALGNLDDRERIISILNSVLKNRKLIFPIEEKVSERIKSFLKDHSGIEQLFQNDPSLSEEG